MAKILIFAGTTEGRKLVEALNGTEHFVLSCVATEYGRELLNCDSVHVGRMEQKDMEELLNSTNFDFVVDSTHPYAEIVSMNIKNACEKTGKNYLRLLRASAFKKSAQAGKNSINIKTDEPIIWVENTEEAVNFINDTEGNVLLTTGSKELNKYTKIKNYEKRLFARVLPMEEVVKSCTELGFDCKHLICMQGPFTYDINIAMLKMLNCKYMVTKDSGKVGGTFDKLRAAEELGIKTVVIGRPTVEEGYSLEEILMLINTEVRIDVPEKFIEDNRKKLKKYFPLFTDISKKNILVVGFGIIAQRRINTLLNFYCNIKVVARELEKKDGVGEKESELLAKLENRNSVLLEKSFEQGDLQNIDIVIAATDDVKLNSEIAQLCRQKNILVNICTSKEDCDFYFPGIVISSDAVVGITAEGNNHQKARELTEKIKTIM